jgi:hypothetical protein
LPAPTVLSPLHANSGNPVADGQADHSAVRGASGTVTTLRVIVRVPLQRFPLGLG